MRAMDCDKNGTFCSKGRGSYIVNQMSTKLKITERKTSQPPSRVQRIDVRVKRIYLESVHMDVNYSDYNSLYNYRVHRIDYNNLHDCLTIMEVTPDFSNNV